MFEIVLVEPEIPPNTGNVIRLTANTGCRLHLVQPLGFDLSDKQMRRAGLDYHEYAEMVVHADWAALLSAIAGQRRFAFTTKASRNYAEIAFQPGDVFVFLPMLPGQRSLNLSNAVAVTVFEAWRQQGFAGADLR